MLTRLLCREPPGEQTALLLENLAAIAEAQAPLGEALPMVAESIGDRHLKQRIDAALAHNADQGAAAVFGQLLPPRVTRLLDFGLGYGPLPEVLKSLAEQESQRSAIVRRIYRVLAYPTLVLVLLGALLFFLGTVVAPPFQEIFNEFELELPAATEAAMSLADMAPRVGVAVVGGLVAITLALLWPPTCRGVHWLRTSLPLLGRAWVWAGHEQFCSQMATLCRMGAPVDEALRHAAAGQRDRHIAGAIRGVGRRCQRGRTLGEAMADSRDFERTLTALVAAGESAAALPEAFDDAASEYRAQLDAYAVFLSRIVLPVVTVLVGVSVLGFVAAMFIPLVSLIENLS
ncbi:MAG: type II secretion system F family protein [Planctomycetota bacterium]